MSFPDTLPVPEQVLDIARRLEQAGYEAWCVGGALRDVLLDHPHSDYDIATSATPAQVREVFRRTAAVGEKYGTIGVIDRDGVVHEVTTFRRDVATDGRHAVVAYGVTLEDDLARRDFTINAIAYHPLRREWRDPYGGRTDLARSIVRAVGDPAARFREDYLRILRAVRFAARFGFSIEPATWEAAVQAAPGLARLSAERVRDEWIKGLTTALRLGSLVELWVRVGAAAHWLPELLAAPADCLRWAEAEPRSGRDPIMLTVLLAGEAAPALLRRLRASNAEVERAALAIRGPGAPASPGEADVRRWLSSTGRAADDILTLHRLSVGAPASWEATARAVRERGDPLRRGDLAVSGRDLESLVARGPKVGELLSRLLDRVLEDPGLNRRETLLALARELA